MELVRHKLGNYIEPMVGVYVAKKSLGLRMKLVRPVKRRLFEIVTIMLESLKI